MHFYSGLLMYFCSGVDTESVADYLDFAGIAAGYAARTANGHERAVAILILVRVLSIGSMWPLSD